MSADGINSFRDGLSAAANGATDPLGRQGEWLKCKLADVVEKIETGKNIIAGSGRSRFRILKVSAVTTGVYAEQESKPAPDRFEPDTRSIVRVGDFLFSRANTAELVGATALVDSTDGNTLLPDKLWRVVWTDRVDPTFMLYMLHSAEMRLAISREATGTSASMRNVSQLKFLGIPVSLPSLSEQHRIVDILDRAAAIQKLQKEAVEKAQEIVPALFVDIFGDPERNPKGFVSRKMADVVNVVSSVKKPDIADEHSTLCLGSDAIEEATGRLLFRPTVQDVQPKSGKYRFQLNDVLYSKIRPALRKATIADVSGYCSADIYAK